MPPTVSWPTSRPSYVTTNGSIVPAPGLRGQVAHHRRERASPGRRAAGSPPTARASSTLRPRTSTHASRSRAADRPQPDRPLREGDRPAAGHRAWLSGRPRASGRPRGRAAGRARPARRARHRASPGRLTTSVRPASAGQPTGQRRRRHALRDSVGPHRLGDARQLAVEHPAGHLRSAVGRRDPGAARGHHDVVRRRDRRAQRRLHRIAVGHDLAARRRRSRAPSGPSTSIGPVRSS